jgi:hypothetical protein
MKAGIRRLVLVLSFLFLFGAGVVGGYLYFSRFMPVEKPGEVASHPENLTVQEDLFSLRIYFPSGDRLTEEERMVPRKTEQAALAEAVVREFLKGPAGESSFRMPRNAKLLGIYRGSDRILYVDLSDEFRKDFRGDVYDEFLLLKGLYESIISNVGEVEDVKVLIEGREADSLGGHFYLLYPLRETVSYEGR